MTVCARIARFSWVCPLAAGFLASAGVAATGQEKPLDLKIPEIVVVGRQLPVIRSSRPPRPAPERLFFADAFRLPGFEEVAPAPLDIPFRPGPDFAPSVQTPNDCYGSPSSAEKLIEEEGARAHFRVGWIALQAGQRDYAERQFQSGLQKQPDPITASYLGYWLGEVYARGGEMGKAREAWLRVSRAPSAPYAGPALLRLGTADYVRKNFRSARDRWEGVVNRFPEFPGKGFAAFWAGEAALKEKDLIRAHWLFAGVPSWVSPREDGALVRLAKFREGTTLFRLGRFREATKALEAFLRFPALDPRRELQARQVLGWSLHFAGRSEDAAGVFSRLADGGRTPADERSRAEAGLGRLITALALRRERDAWDAWDRLKGMRRGGRPVLWGAVALGTSLIRSGRPELATRMLEGVSLEGGESGASGESELRARVRLLRGIALYNADGRFHEAADAFRVLAESEDASMDERRAEARYGRMMALLAAGDTEAAVAASETFLSEHPSNRLAGEAHFWRGEALLRLERFAAARRAFQGVPADHPKRPEAVLGIADSYRGESLWPEAVQAFREAADLLAANPPLRAEARLRMGEALFNAKEFEKADALFRALMTDAPGSPAAQMAALRIGEAEFLRSDYPAAERTFADFLRRWPRNPHRDRALYWKGLAQIRMERFTLARVSLERLVRDFPQSPLRTAALLQIGHAYYNEGRLNEAGETYQRVLVESPASKEAREARYGVVVTRLRSGNTKQFIRDARSLILREPNHELATALEFQVAEIYLAQKQYSDALAAYVRVLRRGGAESDVASFRIGEIKRLQGKPGEAAEYFRDLLEKYPESSMRGEARFQLAESLAALGDCEGALGHYREFLQRFPDHSLRAQVLYAGGTCAVKIRNFAGAADLFSRVVRAGSPPTLVARSHYELGRIARQNNRYQEALEHMEAALKGGVSRELHPHIQYELGSLRRLLKQHARAVVEYLKVVYLYPDERSLGHRALLQVAGIYELQGKQSQALELYRKVEKEADQPSLKLQAGERIRVLQKATRENSGQPAEMPR